MIGLLWFVCNLRHNQKLVFVFSGLLLAIFVTTQRVSNILLAEPNKHAVLKKLNHENVPLVISLKLSLVSTQHSYLCLFLYNLMNLPDFCSYLIYLLRASRFIFKNFVQLLKSKQIGDQFLKMGCFLENSNDINHKHTDMISLNKLDHVEKFCWFFFLRNFVSRIKRRE